MGCTGTPLYDDSQGMDSRWNSYGSCAHRMRHLFGRHRKLTRLMQGSYLLCFVQPFQNDLLLNSERVLSKAFDADNDTFTEHFYGTIRR